MDIEKILSLTMFAEDSGDVGGGGNDATGDGESNDVGSSEDKGEEETGDGESKDSDTDSPGGESDEEDEAKSDEENKDDSEPYTAESFELPEGMEIDATMMDAFLEVANNKELSGKERDQALVSLYAGKMQEARDSQLEQWESVREGWKKESETHKEFGGKQYKENKATMMLGLQHYGSKELVEMGEHFGWIDNPHYQSLLFKIGKTVKEGSLVTGDPKVGELAIEDRWYKK